MKLLTQFSITLALSCLVCAGPAFSAESSPGASSGEVEATGPSSGNLGQSSISIAAPSAVSAFSSPNLGPQIASDDANASSVVPQFRTSFIGSQLQSTNLGNQGASSLTVTFARNKPTPAYVMGPYLSSPARTLTSSLSPQLVPGKPPYVMGPYLQSPSIGVVPSVPASASPSNAGTSDIRLLQGVRSADLVTNITASVPGAPAPTGLMVAVVAALTLMKSGGRPRRG